MRWNVKSRLLNYFLLRATVSKPLSTYSRMVDVADALSGADVAVEQCKFMAMVAASSGLTPTTDGSPRERFRFAGYTKMAAPPRSGGTGARLLIQGRRGWRHGASLWLPRVRLDACLVTAGPSSAGAYPVYAGGRRQRFIRRDLSRYRCRRSPGGGGPAAARAPPQGPRGSGARYSGPVSCPETPASRGHAAAHSG